MTSQIAPQWSERRVAVSDLKPYERNPRRITEASFARLKASIQSMGYHQRILAQPDLRVIGGHQRIKALKELGINEITVLVPDRELSLEEFKRLLIQDNIPFGEFNWDMMKTDFAFDDLRDWGLPVEWLAKAKPDLDDAKADATPALQAKIVSRTGDLWLLGGHRLLCGDSTNADVVSLLMAGGMADLVFTDPPYNVDYSGRGQNNLGTIKNDAMPEKDFIVFLRAVFARIQESMRPLACIYVCHPDGASAPKLAFESTFAEFFHKSATLIWSKQSAGMGWQDYRAQHEPMLYGWKEGTGKHYFCADRSKTTVWAIGRDAQASYQHPTQKPVALAAEAINNSSLPDNIVVDMFGGSGSTLIACEATGRQARVM